MLVCASDRHDQVSTLNRAQEQQALTVGWIPNSNNTADNSFDIELRVPNERIDQVEIAFEIIAKILVDDFRYRLSKNELLRR